MRVLEIDTSAIEWSSVEDAYGDPVFVPVFVDVELDEEDIAGLLDVQRRVVDRVLGQRTRRGSGSRVHEIVPVLRGAWVTSRQRKTVVALERAMFKRVRREVLLDGASEADGGVRVSSRDGGIVLDPYEDLASVAVKSSSNSVVVRDLEFEVSVSLNP